MLLHELLDKAAEDAPDNIAVQEKANTITYSELKAKSDYLSGLLIKCGFGNKKNTAIILNKSINYIIAIFGILKSGGAYVPLDIETPPERIKYILNDADIRFIITDSQNIITLKKHLAEYEKYQYIIIDDHIQKEAGNRLPADFNGATEITAGAVKVSPIDVAYILYTSGSTGKPKGIILSHKNAMAFIRWAYEYFSINENDVLSSHAPFHFDLSIFDIYVTIAAGAKLCLLPKGITPFPKSIIHFITKNQITTWYSVPSVLLSLVIHAGDLLESIHSLKKIIYAGEPFPVNYLNQLRKALPDTSFYNLYGPTETNVITYYKLPGSGETFTEEIPIGSACPYADIKILTENGKIAGRHEKGELVVKCDTLMTGYLNNQALTEARVRELPGLSKEKYYFTGDIVEVVEEGVYRFLYRNDNLIKKDGYRIEIEEIERTILRIPGVQECAVMAVNSNSKKKIVAHIAIPAPPQKHDFIKHLKHYLPNYMVPDEIVFYRKLKRNSRGKIDRNALTVYGEKK